jgi:hypothetical protein
MSAVRSRHRPPANYLTQLAFAFFVRLAGSTACQFFDKAQKI